MKRFQGAGGSGLLRRLRGSVLGALGLRERDDLASVSLEHSATVEPAPSRRTLHEQTSVTLDTAPRNRALPCVGECVAERFTLKAEVGRGAMGVVFRAYDAELERDVALKFVSGDGDEVRERFKQEARALARVKHVNVADIYELGQSGRAYFVVFEYIAGMTLRRWLELAPRTNDEILVVMIAAGRGLEAAHAEGVIHRDFKPSNVMIDESGQARVLDFGLAAIAGRAESDNASAGEEVATSRLPNRLTRVGEFVGTPAYAAPEQFESTAITGPASDQFSFCVTLYEALWGRLPFERSVETNASSRAALIRLRDRVRNEQPFVLSPGRAASGRLWQVVLRGLARDPKQRFQSMTELLAALEHIAERQRSGPRRRVLLIGGSTVAAMGLGVGVMFAAQDEGSQDEGSQDLESGPSEGALRSQSRSLRVQLVDELLSRFGPGAWVRGEAVDAKREPWTQSETLAGLLATPELDAERMRKLVRPMEALFSMKRENGFPGGDVIKYVHFEPVAWSVIAWGLAANRATELGLEEARVRAELAELRVVARRYRNGDLFSQFPDDPKWEHSFYATALMLLAEQSISKADQDEGLLSSLASSLLDSAVPAFGAAGWPAKDTPGERPDLPISLIGNLALLGSLSDAALREAVRMRDQDFPAWVPTLQRQARSNGDPFGETVNWFDGPGENDHPAREPWLPWVIATSEAWLRHSVRFRELSSEQSAVRENWSYYLDAVTDRGVDKLHAWELAELLFALSRA